jgi:ankyrin repeat protein
MVIKKNFSIFFLFFINSLSYSAEAYRAGWNSRKAFCNSRIMRAIDEGDTKAIKSLLSHENSYIVGQTLKSSINKFKCRPLKLAIERRKVDIVRALLESGAPVYDSQDYEYALSRKSFGIALLVNAARKKCLEQATDAMDRQDPLLHAAIDLEDYTTFEALINDGRNLEELNNEQETPLMYAAQTGDARAVQLLLLRGVSVQSQDRYRQGVMHHAVHGGNVECVKLLLQADAPFDKSSDLDVYPDGLACKKNRYDLASLLQDHDENMLMQSILFKDVRGVAKCVHGGYRIDYRLSEDDQMPLHMAIKFYHKDIVDILLHKGAARVKNFADVTPLQKAVKRSMIGPVIDIITSGVNIDEQSLLGSTALHIAVEHSNYVLAAVLLNEGASLAVRDMWEQTPLDIANEIGDGPMQGILRAFDEKRK